MTIQKEEPLEEDKVTPLRVITGGKMPPKRGKNWLRDLKPWSVFLARVLTPQPNCECFLFQLRAKYANSCELLCHLPKEPQPQLRWFSMEHFSNDYELTEILEDGNSSGSNLDRGLEVDANVEQDNTIPSSTG